MQSSRSWCPRRGIACAGPFGTSCRAASLVFIRKAANISPGNRNVTEMSWRRNESTNHFMTEPAIGYRIMDFATDLRVMTYG